MKLNKRYLDYVQPAGPMVRPTTVVSKKIAAAKALMPPSPAGAPQTLVLKKTGSMGGSDMLIAVELKGRVS